MNAISRCPSAPVAHHPRFPGGGKRCEARTDSRCPTSATPMRLAGHAAPRALGRLVSGEVVTSLAGAGAGAGGDVSVLITISGLLLLFYWVANFVVPQIIMKDLRSPDGGGEANAAAQEEATRKD